MLVTVVMVMMMMVVVGGGGTVPMMVLRSSHVCRWNSSSVEASMARSTSVRLNGGGSSTPSCEATILQAWEVFSY